MNNEYILYNLRDAQEQLTSIINEIENDDEFDIESYSVDIQHLYHHINTSWNARFASKVESDECSEENFVKWRQFPNDIEMGI